MDDEILESVRRWLVKADHDLQTAETMLRQRNPPTDVVCFHAQQTVEKCLKAYLTRAGVHLEKTHDLVRLLAECARIRKDFSHSRTLRLR